MMQSIYAFISKIKRKLKQESGQTLVEFALIMPVFLIIICGIIDFGYIAYQKNSLTNTTGGTARYAAIAYAGNGIDEDNLQDIVEDYVQKRNEESGSHITIESVSVIDLSDNVHGVTVALKEECSFLTGMTGILRMGDNTITIHSKSTMPVEPYMTENEDDDEEKEEEEEEEYYRYTIQCIDEETGDVLETEDGEGIANEVLDPIDAPSIPDYTSLRPQITGVILEHDGQLITVKYRYTGETHETNPHETEPSETEPVETDPSETVPSETEPEETTPETTPETEPETVPNPVITVNKHSLTLNKNIQERLTYHTENTLNGIVWSSSDEAIASVNSQGIVTANGAGVANITATISGTDISDTCVVTVKDEAVVMVKIEDNNTWGSAGNYTHGIKITFINNSGNTINNWKIAIDVPENINSITTWNTTSSSSGKTVTFASKQWTNSEKLVPGNVDGGEGQVVMTSNEKLTGTYPARIIQGN